MFDMMEHRLEPNLSHDFCSKMEVMNSCISNTGGSRAQNGIYRNE